jgi:hypothetical protein
MPKYVKIGPFFAAGSAFLDKGVLTNRCWTGQGSAFRTGQGSPPDTLVEEHSEKRSHRRREDT